MNEKETGGPAFPQEVAYLVSGQDYQHRGPKGGMTLRDYFAAKAMQAMLDAASKDQASSLSDFREAVSLIPSSAYHIADGMLAERSK